MTDMTISVDLGHVASQLGLPQAKVQRTVDLLDEGNTVPFITRYRKDQTGGLDEEQIRLIQADVARQRQLAERKATILKSVESQGKLTAELAEQIRGARSAKHLEDLYLPFKPKKQTLATQARQRGLEPLAMEVLAGAPEAADLAARAAQFLNPEQKLHTVDDVLTGVRHILAEQFSERAELRSRLRRLLQRTGKLTSLRVEPDHRAENAAAAATATPTEAVLTEAAPTEAAPTEAVPAEAVPAEAVPAEAVPTEAVPAEAVADAAATTATVESAALPASDATAPAADAASTAPAATAAVDSSETGAAAPVAAEAAAVESSPVEAAATEDAAAAEEENDEADSDEVDELDADDDDADDDDDENLELDESLAGADGTTDEDAELPEAGADGGDAVAGAEAGGREAGRAAAAGRMTARQQARVAAREAKKKKKQKLIESLYKDYYKYEEPLSKVPPHRVLAINRGERSHVLRVKIVADDAAIEKEALTLLAPAEHPHAEFLQSCGRDALMRLVVPSLEREVRREMTERAEQHAVEVFIRNLRKLLLQPPVHGRRVLAIDPGFRSGCKLAALDEFGNLLDHGTIHIIGPEQHRQVCRQRLVDTIKKLDITVIAIGNGTACRETEVLIADVMNNELLEHDVAYVIVNEAGASVYSTSPIGREELPKYDATVRGAVSIGRRLLDPLSELVKINPANIGVGLYQHDLKAKHLRDSLDAVVESCVNYVGVEVNTASPALLRYVSGLNQLTARRLYEYRLQHGPFQNREQFKQVPGFGDATFVQAAGFLKILGGDNPLDATWIHPESYPVARRVLEELNSSEAELAAEVGPLRIIAPAPAAPPVFGGQSLLAELNAASAAAAEAAATSAAATEATAPTESVVPTESLAPTEAAVPTEAAPIVEADSGSLESSTAEQVASETVTAEGETPVMGEIAGSETLSSETLSSETLSSEALSSETLSSETLSSETVTHESAEPAAADAPPAESLATRIERLDVDRLATEWQIGSLALKDILQSLARPSRDPREDLPPPIFRRGIMKLEDLSAGMELSGTVLNVVDFGVFVDIGLSDSALIHISRLADKFIRDPHEVVGIGDVLKVWVVDVDKQRRRVSLTAIQPGSEKPRESREARGGRRGGERGGERGGPGGDGVAAAGGRSSGGRTGQRGGPGGAAAGRGPGGATGRFGGAGQGGRPGGDRGPGGAGPSARGGGPGGDRFSGRPGGRPQMGPGAGSGGERDAAQAGGRGPRGGEAGRGGGRPGRGGGGAGGSGFTRPPQKPKPSQPSRPITQNMMEGKEPMRAFSDLLQFYQKKKDDDGETDKRGG